MLNAFWTFCIAYNHVNVNIGLLYFKAESMPMNYCLSYGRERKATTLKMMRMTKKMMRMMMTMVVRTMASDLASLVHSLVAFTALVTALCKVVSTSCWSILWWWGWHHLHSFMIALYRVGNWLPPRPVRNFLTLFFLYSFKAILCYFMGLFLWVPSLISSLLRQKMVYELYMLHFIITYVGSKSWYLV